eukprot:16440470-Heterocapsa_arctica.AAC.1
MGSRGRFLRAAPACSPTLAEWTTHLALPGPRGGCEAKKLWTGDRETLPLFWSAAAVSRRSPSSFPFQSAAEVGESQNCWELFQQTLHKKAFKAVPFWSCPAAVWKIACEHIAWQRALYILLHMIHVVQVVPLQWNVSFGCPIPKWNGKQGCLALRLIHILDDIGK